MNLRTRTTAVLVGLGITATGAASAAMAAPAPAGTTSTFRVGQLNIEYGMPLAQFREDLAKVTSRSDIVGLNEVSGRTAFLKKWADNNGWYLYAPGGTAQRDNAMLARKSRFRVLDHGTVFSVDTYGPDRIPPAKYINWVRYEDKKTGIDIFHMGLHLNSQIDAGGHPRAGQRTQDAQKQLRQVRDLAWNFHSKGEVVVTGDFNVDYVADKRVASAHFPYTVLEERQRRATLPALRSNYSAVGVKDEGTHGDRHIDYVYLWERKPEYKKLLMTGYQVVEGTHSDHDGVVAGFKLVKKG